jgi:hypothetical protein
MSLINSKPLAPAKAKSRLHLLTVAPTTAALTAGHKQTPIPPSIWPVLLPALLVNPLHFTA